MEHCQCRWPRNAEQSAEELLQQRLCGAWPQLLLPAIRPGVKLLHFYTKRFNAKHRSATHRPDKKDFNTSARSNSKLHCLLLPVVGKRGCHSGRYRTVSLSPLGAELCTEGRKTPGLLQRVVLLTDPHRLSTEQRILTTAGACSSCGKGNREVSQWHYPGLRFGDTEDASVCVPGVSGGDAFGHRCDSQA